MAAEPIWVALNEHERAMGAKEGTARQDDAVRRGLKDKYGFEGDPLEIHINGARGEIGFAKVVGAHWRSSVGTFKSGYDVGKLQVRTRSRHDYELIFRPDDQPMESQPFVLVLGNFSLFSVVGWIIGRDARRDEWLQTHANRPKAWFVPQERLLDIRELSPDLTGGTGPLRRSIDLAEWVREAFENGDQ
jgi:hypothetical protein